MVVIAAAEAAGAVEAPAKLQFEIIIIIIFI
jgi:hypothetical protein